MTYAVPEILGDLSIPALRTSGSMKWSMFPDRIHGHETLPCFVAEMDFTPATPIRQALTRWAANGSLGYRDPALVENFQRVVRQYFSTVGLEISDAAIRPISDVMTAYDVVARLFTPADSPITLMTPAYMNFVRHIFSDQRRIQSVDMLSPDGLHDHWRVDWEALEHAMSGGGLLVLVNPHNPIGKVYTRTELETIAEMAQRHGVRVFSDEIHSPLVYNGHRHLPFASVNTQAAEVAITAWSATKAYSIPGTKAASLIFTNPADADLWHRHAQHFEMGTASSGYIASIAALDHGQQWFDAALQQLDSNRRLFDELVSCHLPGARYHQPESTYLAWLDLRSTPNYAKFARHVTEHRSLADITAEHSGVIATDGAETGASGEGHLRINFATAPAIIGRIVTRLGEVYAG